MLMMKQIKHHLNKLNEPIQVVYATPTGQFYFQPLNQRKNLMLILNNNNNNQLLFQRYIQQLQLFIHHIIIILHKHNMLMPSYPTFFQPIVHLPSLVIDTKPEQNDIDDVDIE